MPTYTFSEASFAFQKRLLIFLMLLLPGTIALAQPLSATLTATPSSLSATNLSSLSATVRGGTAPYSFTFNGPGAITAAGGATATVTALPPGIHSFMATVRDSGVPTSQTTTATTSVTVPGGALVGTTTICAGQSTTLAVNVTNAVGPFVLIYSSTPAGSTSAISTTVLSYTSGSPIVVNPSVTTSYALVSLIQTNGFPVAVGGGAVVTVNPAPTINLLGNPVLCTGTSSPFTSITATGSTGPYVLNGTLFGSPFTQTDPTGVFLLTQPGAYSITGSNAICTRTVTFTVTTGVAVPNPSLVASTSVLSCSVSSVSLVATTGAINYAFSYQVNSFSPSTLLQTGASNVFSASVAGVYTVSMTGLSGCVSTATTALVGNVTVPGGSFSATGEVNCRNLPVTLTATGGAPGSIYFFVGQGQLMTSYTGSVTVAAPGTYSVIFTGENGCRTTLSTVVTSNTTVPGAFLFTDGALSCTNARITLSTTSGQREYAFSGPNFFVASTTNSVTINTPGLYQVAVVGQNGCTSTSSLSVGFLNNAGIATLSTANGSNQLTCSQTSLTLIATGNGTQFNFNSPALATSQFGPNNTLVVNQPGTYYVTVVGQNGCTSAASFAVVSNTLATPPVVTVSGVLGCSPSLVTLETGLIGPRYEFTGPNGFRVVNITGRAIVSDPGTYTLVATNPSTGCSAVTFIPVTSTCVNTPSPTEPVGTAFNILAPAYNCQTGVISLLTTGGDGSTITFVTPGITRTTPQSTTGMVEAGLRFDPKPITIRATQSGKTVSYDFDLRNFCVRTRMATTETPSMLDVTVLGNPTTAESVAVEVRGGESGWLRYQVFDGTGRLITDHQTETAPAIDRQTLRLGSGSGLYLLQITSPTQRKTVKVVRQ
jgi:hypothetical protein